MRHEAGGGVVNAPREYGIQAQHMNQPAATDDAPSSSSVAQPDQFPGQPLYSRNFWLVFSAHFALNCSSNLFVLFPLFVVKLGATATTIGVLMGTGSLAALLMRPGVGAGIDRFGRRRVAMCFLVLDAIASSFYLGIGSLGWPIYAVRALQGAIDGTARVALFAMVYQILPAGRRGEGMATFSLCGMIPGALAPMIGEELIKRLGFHAFFAGNVLLCLIAALATSRLPDDRTHASAHHVTPNPEQGAGLGAVLFDRELMPLWIVTLLFAFAISCRLSFVTPYAYKMGIARVGWYFLIYSSAAVMLRAFSGGLMDRVGLERMMLPSLIILSFGLALLAETGRPGMLLVAALVGGIGHGYLYPALSALVIARTKLPAIGRSSTIYSSLYDLGAMAGPYTLGVLAGMFGYAPMFVVAGALVMIAALYFAAAEPAVLQRRLA